MPISYPASGYTFQPQFAQTGALQGLQPLDVTRGAKFDVKPLSQIEIQSSRPELVAQGIAKGIEAAVGGITSGITAKWKSEQEKEAATTKYKRDFVLAGIRAGKDNEDILKRQKELIDYRSEVEDRKKKSLPAKYGNYPVYGESDSTDSTDSTDDIDYAGTLPDVAKVIEGTESSLFSSITPPTELNAKINAQRESDARLASAVSQIQNLPLSELSASTEGAVPAKIEKPSSEFTLTNIPSSLISPEQQEEAISTRKELRKTLAGIERPTVKEDLPQQPGWYPIGLAEKESSRKIKGWKPAEIDKKEVRTINGVPHFLVLPRTALTQKEIAEEKAAVSAPVLSKDQIAVYDKLVSNVQQNPLIKNAIDAKSSQSVIHQSLSENNGFGDITAINAFQRMVDPGVAVREGDVTLLQSAIPRLRKLGLTVSNLVEGDKLTEEARQQLRNLSFKLAKTRSELAKDSISDLRLTAQDAGINPDRVVREITFEEQKKEAQQNKKQEIESQLNSMQKGTPEYQKKYRELIDIIKAEKTAAKQIPQATPQTTPQPVFQPAIPRQPQQYGETLESFLGNK